MLCPQCHTPLVGPTCPCGWSEKFPNPEDFFDDDIPDYRFYELFPHEFMMGSPTNEEGRDEDEYLHTVLLTQPYAIGCTEVPQDLFMAIMHDNPSSFIGQQKPVDSISWFEACSFCNSYSVITGKEPVYRFQADGYVDWDPNSNGYRLPTEAEWEFAARKAQKQSPLTSQAWFQENSEMETHNVGRNAGVSDMAGNVWEWVWDWYAKYPDSAQNPTGPKYGTHRVARGGCWADGPRVIRPANRAYAPPRHESNTIGFRIAYSILREDK